MIDENLSPFYDNYSRAFTSSNRYISEESDKHDYMLNAYEDLLLFDQSLQFCESRKEIVELFCEFFNNNTLLCHHEVLIKEDLPNLYDDIYPILNSEHDLYLFAKVSSMYLDDEKMFIISTLLSFIEKQLSQSLEGKSLIGTYEKAISKLVTPFALFVCFR